MDKLAQTIQDRKDISYDSLANKRILWDEVESLFSNKLTDAISSNTKSQVMDQRLSTLILEREARVMAQLPVGKYRPVSSDDIGATKLINLVAEKYIVPNATAQFPLLTKLRMMDRYSNIYGNFFALVDWDVKQNGYIGPDLWLLAMRDVFPQVGAISLTDSDYAIVRTWKPLSYFKALKSKTFKNIPQLVEALKDKGGDRVDRDPSDESVRESQQAVKKEAKGKGFYEVLTMFEKDRWVDYVPSAKMIFRDIKNPHDNGELPLVCKYSIPMIDDNMGMGDMERGKTMQYTSNSLWNLYLDAIKISIFPPTILNKDNIIASTIKWGPGAKWLVRNSVGNSVQQLAINPRGIEAFQSTSNMVNASLMNMFGSTDTSTTQTADVAYGKTPQALKMQSQRESSKDNVDRFYMEQTVSDIMRKFANLWSKKAPSNITVRMFKGEINDLATSYPEIKEMWNPKSGKLTIDKKITGSTLYDYEIVPGSTYQMDNEKQQASLREMFSILTNGMAPGPQGMTFPIIEAIAKEGKQVKLGELLTRIIAGSGIQDYSKIIVDQNQVEGDTQVTPEEEKSMLDDQNQFLSMIQAMQDGGGGSINAVPPQPGQEQGMPTEPPLQVPPMGGPQMNGQ